MSDELTSTHPLGEAIALAVARRQVHKAQTGQVAAARTDYEQTVTRLTPTERQRFENALVYFALQEDPHV